MTTTLTWIGGGNNDWNNPTDWQPNGVPAPGDTLLIGQGTINLQHTHLAGDTLQVTGGAPTINLNGGASVKLAAGVDKSFSLNVSGHNSLNAQVGTGDETDHVTIANTADLVLRGSFSAAGIDINSNGAPPQGKLILDNGVISSSFIRINANVLGHGTINFLGWHDGPGSHSVDGSSGSGITYDIGSFGNGDDVTIAHPNTFKSTIDLTGGPGVYIGLSGLSADSYDFKHDLLTLYQGNKAVYHLKLDTTAQFDVTSGTGGVAVVTPYQGQQLSGVLPQHSLTS